MESVGRVTCRCLIRAMWVRSERRVDAEMKIGDVVMVVESVLPWSDAMDERLQSSNPLVRLTLAQCGSKQTEED